MHRINLELCCSAWFLSSSALSWWLESVQNFMHSQDINPLGCCNVKCPGFLIKRWNFRSPPSVFVFDAAVHFSISLSLSLFHSLSFTLSFTLFHSLSFTLSLSLSLFLSVCLSVCLSFCRCLEQSHHSTVPVCCSVCLIKLI